MTQRIVSRASFLVLASAVAFLVLMGLLVWDRTNAANQSQAWVTHTYAVISTVRDLEAAVREAESSQRGYLLTGRDDFLNSFSTARADADRLFDGLKALTTDNAVQQARLQFLLPAWQRRLQQFNQTITIRQVQGLQGVVEIMQGTVGRDTMKGIEDALSAMDAEEQRLLAVRLAEADARSDWLRRLIYILTGLAVCVILLSVRMMTGAFRRTYDAEAQQRATASALRATLDALSQGVGVFGPHHRLRHWNECFQILLDLPRSLQAGKTTYDDVVQAVRRDNDVALEQADQIMPGPAGEIEPVVYEEQMRNGRVLEIRRTPAPDGGFVLTATDMTKRTEADALLREAQKMQAIGQLTGGMAHDFNNLLTVVIGNLELGKMKLEAGHPLQAHLDRAVGAAQRGATLTQRLLAFARKQPLAPAPVNLSQTLPELIPLLRRTLGEHIEVRFVDAAGLWLAMSDPAQLESAVLNLALNARDAMPHGGRLTIELANKVLDETYARAHTEVISGDYVMIAVSDTGHGMTPEVIARAFEPFFTTKTGGRGTGLGLAMVFGFVKQSGGHVKIYSEPNEGTSVKIYLPRAVAATVGQRRAPRADLPQGNATILIVEDEAGVREVTVSILRGLGYRILDAPDGEEGLRVFEAHANDIDMLLTDVVLPGRLRGRDLAEQVTALRPEVKVLFMSGYTENSIVHHGRLDDGVQLIGKPFKREELARKVAEVLAAPGNTQPEGEPAD